jgi:hypothetical protein
MSARSRRVSRLETSGGKGRYVLCVSEHEHETVEEAQERHYKARPQDRGVGQFVLVHTGIDRRERSA